MHLAKRQAAAAGGNLEHKLKTLIHAKGGEKKMAKTRHP